MCPQKYARPLCLALLVLVVAWNVARARTAARKRERGTSEAGRRALLNGKMSSLTDVPGDPLSASLFGGVLSEDVDTLLPEQLAALLSGHDLELSSRVGAPRGPPVTAEGAPFGSAGPGRVPSTKPLQPHQLAALLGASGHSKASWSAEDETSYSDDSSLG